MDEWTAFLNARLDEKERTAGEYHHEDCDAIRYDHRCCSCDYPARALRDVEAGRAILALHSPETGKHPDYCWHDLHMLPCPTLRALAAAWSGHPDYPGR